MYTYQDEGFSFHLDDFGTGYSSMRYLTEFPVSVIKLDGSFVNVLMHNEKSYNIVKTSILMAEALKLKFVAEGIETEEQFLQLKDMGCKYYQGYYFAKPMPEEELLVLIKADQ